MSEIILSVNNFIGTHTNGFESVWHIYKVKVTYKKPNTAQN